MKKEHLSIEKVDRLSSEAVQITFSIPEELRETYQYQAGQYVSLTTEIQGEAIRRSYSICSAPHENRLSVGIKAIPNGVFSNHAQSLAAGNVLEVGVPEGRFLYQKESQDQVGIAAGSGITPIMSILKTHLENSEENRFTLIYGNKSPEKTLFYDELTALEQQYSGRLNIHWIFSQSSESHAGFGRIDTGFLKNKLKDLPAQPAYLCGPEALIQLSQECLQDMGFASDQILFELFFSSSTAETVAGKAGEGSLEIICDGETHQLTLAGESILDAALKHKIDVPYSCQGGVCSSCIAKVTEGKARMEANQILTDGEVADGLVLTCQAYAETSKIVVDYDDV